MKPRLLWFAIPMLAVACGPKFIAWSQVPDTPENRVVADLVEKYRQAIEKRDVQALKQIVSRRYFANAGTTSESGDDYGYDQLEQKVMPLLQESVKSVQYHVYLRKIERTAPDRASAEFEFYYKFFYVDGGKDRWVANNDFMRLDLALEDGVWRIAGGL